MLADLLLALGDDVADLEEEAFILFSQPFPSQNLGFVDSKSSTIGLTVAGRDLIIHQSPTILNSSRKEGTTGAVLWKVTPLFAEWLAQADNVFFRHGCLGPNSTVLELGTGISGVIAVTLTPLIGQYIATDQDYVVKFLRKNIDENAPPSRRSSRPGRSKKEKMKAETEQSGFNVSFIPLDWETDSVDALPGLPRSGGAEGNSHSGGVDAIIACDCVYNDSLVDPFVSTCADICRLRLGNDEAPPTLCIVAQQLRTAEVFEAWLKRFYRDFRVWRVPDGSLIDGLKEGSGYVVHVGILRA